MKKIFSLIQLVIVCAVLFFIAKIALPFVPEIIRTLKYQTYSNLSKLNDAKEKELLTTDEPVFNLEEIKDILQLSTCEQKASVDIDTIVEITKEYRSAALELVGRNKPVWSSCSKARTKLRFVFRIKAGFNLQDSKFNIQSYSAFDTIYIHIPKPEILSIESELSEFKNLVSEEEKRYEIFDNQRLISSDQNNQIHKKAKDLVVKQTILENLLNIAEIKGKKAISGLYQKMNRNLKIKVETF